ncbi:uncharacterized protein F4817DRAFT_348889 [Daldinia loculata]|uniref:uncharacterized protein n=1 Tax=Daldinia loculata TaxID=103429 RepID=UPI0020C2268A|nr:uncharacterized protein F4817DRAFT_348889 [Daldinia loculata]KAI1643756.1 hypothetical protein F4817DRAFT_348889 [Daldinia loculata]
MLSTMPIFNIDFSTPHRPTRSSPLSSSPIRPSSPPLCSRDHNTLPRLDTQSSPIKAPPSIFKFASRNAKPNPLRQNRENAQESRRNLFLRNIRKRADDKKWERRGGDQEALKLEWSMLDRQRRDQKNADLDGMVFEDEIEDIAELQREAMDNPDDMMIDAIAQEEEEELDAMLSMFEAQTQSSQPPIGAASPAISDDEDYDHLFMDFLSQQERNSQGFISSGQMDMS